MVCLAVLFDMDGVIVDTYQSVTAFWQRLAATHRVHLTQEDFDQHIYGCPAIHTLDSLFSQLGSDERRAVIEQMAQYEIHLAYTGVPGAVEFVRALKQRDIPLALVTSGERWKVDAVCSQLGLEEWFDALVTASDIRLGKPHPDCYLLAAQSLNTPPERCIVFEDSISGAQAAVAAGALCVGIQSSTLALALLEAGASCVVPNFLAVHLTPSDESAGAVGLQCNQGQGVMLHGSSLDGIRG